MTTANRFSSPAVSEVLSPQETALLRSVAQVGAQRATQLVAFYESIFTEVSTHSVSERTKDKAAKQLLSVFPTLGKIGRPQNPDSALSKVRTGVFAAMDTGVFNYKDIVQFVKARNPELSEIQITNCMYGVKGIRRYGGVWSRPSDSK